LTTALTTALTIRLSTVLTIRLTTALTIRLSTVLTIRLTTALTTLSLCLHSVQAYFWKFYPASGKCEVRPELMEDGMASVWSVWSQVTELSVFAAVPLTILALNACVISETRKISARELQLTARFHFSASLLDI